MSFEAEVRNAIDKLDRTVGKLEKSADKANRRLDSMGRSADKAAGKVEKVGRAQSKVARTTKKSTADMGKNFNQLGQGVSQVGGSIGSLGGNLSAVAGMGKGLGAVTIALVAAAGAAKAWAASQRRVIQNLKESIGLAQQVRDARGQAAVAGVGGLRDRAAAVFAGVEGRAENVAFRQGISLEDARGGEQLLRGVGSEQRDVIRRAAVRAAGTGQVSFSEAVQRLVAGGGLARGGESALGGGAARNERIQRMIAARGPQALDAETGLAALAAGVTRGEFTRGERRMQRAGLPTALQRIGRAEFELQREQTDASVRRDATGQLFAEKQLQRQAEEIRDPLLGIMRDQLEVQKQAAETQGTIMRLWDDMIGTFGGEGSERRKLERMRTNIRTAHGISMGGR